MAEYRSPLDNAIFQASDNHNIANGDQSWFEQRANSLVSTGTSIIEGATYGVTAAAVSGLQSIANSGIAFANFVGSEIEPINTYESLRNLDSNLGEYYFKHKEGADIAGFVASSLIPGTLGIKAFQAARAGFIGINTARATGLLPSLTADYAAIARAEFAAGTSPFTLLESNTLKALGQGFGKNALEAASFEILVAGTMFESPILSEQSIKDVGWNMLTGTVLGGGIGGVLHGVGLVSGIRKSRAAVDRELFPYRNINELDSTADPTMKILNYYQQKFNLPEERLLDDLGPLKPGTISKDLDPETRLRLITEERGKTVARIDNLIQQEFQAFAKGDEVIANMAFELVNKAKTLEEVVPALMHTSSLSRITSAEAQVFGDVLFPLQKLTPEKFTALKAGGEWDFLFSPKGSDGSTGFKIIGNLADLRVTGAKLGIATDGYETKDAAFSAGFDVFRNSNGSVSVNPSSKVLARAEDVRAQNNFILDFEKNGSIVDKATPGIQDFATKDKPLTVRGNQVLSGDLPVIQIVPDGLKFNPTSDGVSLAEIQARYIWAQEQKNIKWDGKVVFENDLPMLERAYYDQAKGFLIRNEDGSAIKGPSGSALDAFIYNKKKEMAAFMDGKPLDELGMRLNVTERWLVGEADDLAKIHPGVDYKTPRYIKVNFNTDINALEQLQKNQIDGMIEYERQKTLIQNRHEQNAANYMGTLYDQFPRAPNISDPSRVPTSYGAGSTFFGFANSNYGSYGAWAQFVGTLTNKLKIAKKTETAELLNPNISTVIATGEDAVAEAALLNNRLRGEAEAYVFDPRGGDKLIPRKYVSYGKDGTVKVDKAADTENIVIKEKSVAELFKTHSDINNTRQAHWKNLKGAAGLMDEFDDAVVYPIPIDTEKLKQFAFVKPLEISIGDKTRIIAAKDDATLLKLINQVDQNQYRVVTKKESEEFHKAMGDYDFSKGINESRVDSELKRKGVLSQFIPTTDKSFLDDFMAWHMRQEEMLSTMMVEHKYSQAFKELQHLGDRYTKIATSQFRSLTDALQESVKDPYNDIVRTSLDISRASEYQWWKSFNETVREAIEFPVAKVKEIFKNSQRMDDALAQRINGMAQGMGYSYGWETAALEIANTNIAARPWLAKVIAKGQAIMSASLLQLDFFNAINNTIGSPIILSAEVNTLRKAIAAGDKGVAGRLSELMTVASPDGSGITMPTTTKLIKNAIDNYYGTEGKNLLTRYQKIGAVTDVLQQERQMLDDLTWKFTETESEIGKKLDAAYATGKKWTGNRLAEEMTRFISADVMRQITDLAMQSGVLRSTKEADEYIQLFVNRTQGNYLHSQRPIVFQGVVGQAISLFQTYQFNLMQQLFRYVGEGDKKSIGILLGLQGSMYGTQGLPAFNFLNTHIVGNASGNTNHKDLYEAGNSVFGKALGDWILYGLGSNALSIIDPSLRPNLYSRGDINPRRVTILPTDIADIPLVAASTRFIGNLWNAAQKIGNGADIWPSVSQAVEHNGLSRPLAGLAQGLQGYTTTNKGSLLVGAQDFFSISTLIRLGGAKPFEESIAMDQMYRINAYRAKNLSEIQELGSAIKTTVVAGRNPSEEQMNSFAADYAKRGGSIEHFNRFYTGVMTSANKSQVNKLAEKLQGPFGKQMQVIMGGEPLPDFLNQQMPKE